MNKIFEYCSLLIKKTITNYSAKIPLQNKWNKKRWSGSFFGKIECYFFRLALCPKSFF